MNAVAVEGLRYRYGRAVALDDVSFAVPEGAVYALLGPNGSGKTTLLQILMGLRRAQHRHARVLGVDCSKIGVQERQRIGYVAEGQELPGWMRLEQLEAYLAPLYPTWDCALATSLRDRLDLDPKKKIKAMSRGQAMKAALLCALAFRPKLVLMDEPFTGMDVVVRDELVRGLLDSAGNEGWSVVLCSHDIGEIEMLADWVGFLDAGRMRVSEPMDVLRGRYRRVDVTTASDVRDARTLPAEWLAVERAPRRVSFVAPSVGDVVDEAQVRARLDGVVRIDVREATLRELFVALAKGHRGVSASAVAELAGV